MIIEIYVDLLIEMLVKCQIQALPRYLGVKTCEKLTAEVKQKKRRRQNNLNNTGKENNNLQTQRKTCQIFTPS